MEELIAKWREEADREYAQANELSGPRRYGAMVEAWALRRCADELERAHKELEDRWNDPQEVGHRLAELGVDWHA